MVSQFLGHERKTVPIERTLKDKILIFSLRKDKVKYYFRKYYFKLLIMLRNLIQFLSFIAIALLMFSCGTEEEILPDTLTISANKQQVYLGETINFTVVSQNNGNVTSTADIFVNGEQIEGSSFVPTEVNEENQVYATWNGHTSSTITFKSLEEVVIPDTYTKKVLVEDYTGTWCGYCPGMNNVLNHFVNYSSNVIPVAIHCDDDPYQFEFQAQLQAEYETTGLPKAQIQRINPLQLYVENYVIDYCGTQEAYYHDLIQPYLDQPAPLGLAINSQLNGNNLQFQVKVGFVVDEIPNAKLVVYLLEDGLIYNQVNYFAGTGDPACEYSNYPQNIANFEHNHVLQKVYTDVFGDEIPASEISTNSLYTRNFDVNLPPNIENRENLSLVAFVMGNENNEVINVQFAEVGEDVDFD